MGANDYTGGTEKKDEKKREIICGFLEGTASLN